MSTPTTYHCTCCHGEYEYQGYPEWLYVEDGGQDGYGMCGHCNADICQCWVAVECGADPYEHCNQEDDCKQAQLY